MSESSRARTSAYPVVGVDLGKDCMHLTALDHAGHIAHKARCTRSTVLPSLLWLDAELIAIEACASAHELARQLQAHGRPVRLLVAADVRAFVRGSKTDYNDAQAIAEAALRPTVRSVGVKTIEQQDVQLLHRLRARWVAQRTALINQARAMLLECGIAVGTGRKAIAKRLPELLAKTDLEGLSGAWASVGFRVGFRVRSCLLPSLARQVRCSMSHRQGRCRPARRTVQTPTKPRITPIAQAQSPVPPGSLLSGAARHSSMDRTDPS